MPFKPALQVSIGKLERDWFLCTPVEIDVPDGKEHGDMMTSEVRDLQDGLTMMIAIDQSDGTSTQVSVELGYLDGKELSDSDGRVLEFESLVQPVLDAPGGCGPERLVTLIDAFGNHFIRSKSNLLITNLYGPLKLMSADDGTLRTCVQTLVANFFSLEEPADATVH